MIPEKKGCYHDNDDYRYNLDRLSDLNLPVGLAETVGLQAERVACLILQNHLTRKPGGWGFTEDIPTLATKLEQRLKGAFGENEAFRNEFAPGHGTAFLVTRQLVFTAAHCICYDDSSEVNPKLVNTTRVVFGFHGVKEKRSDYFFSEDQVRTATVVAYQHFRARGRKSFYSEWSDWALLKLEKEVRWEPLPLNFEKVKNKIELYMLGHPNGLSLKLTYNGKLEGNTEHDFFECKIDAFQGNSGSPIFNATTYRVEGILIEGRKDYEVLDNKIQARQITASNIIFNPIGHRMENCQRLSSLHHLVDKGLLDSKELETVQNAPEIIVHSLKELYKSRNTIHRLLEQPLNIDTIYTELVLLSEPKEKDKQEKKTFEENRINSWEDIQGGKKTIALHGLFENRNDKNPKRLLILGRAGIGKSTLCQYIANQWAEGKLWKEKFEAVFWVPLRKLQNAHSSEMAASALFRLCCPLQELFTKDIAHYLEKNREKVLLVLDGLDEITLADDSQQKKILDQLLNFPYWIVTSRPHAAGGIRADETIENVGYASKTIDLYLKKSFPDNATAVIQKLRQNPILFGFCHIPINLELICTILKKSKGDLSRINSMTSLYEELTFTLQKRFLEKIGKPYILDWTSKKLEHNKEIQNDLAVFELLEAIAWMGMQDRQLIFSLNNEKMEKISEEFPDINLENICISGFLQSTQDSDNVLENDYSFLHLTFQEFFAARYLVRLLQNNRIEAEQLIQVVKFNPLYKVVMWFVAGLLRNDEGDFRNLNAFFEMLDAPKDLANLYGTLLKIRCLEECGWQKKLQKIKLYERDIRFWFEKMDTKEWSTPINTYLLEAFEISPQGAKRLFIPMCIPLLNSWFSNTNYYYRKHAIKVFAKVSHFDPETIIQVLLKTLKAEDKEIKKAALEILGQIGHTNLKTIIPPLLDALKDEDSDIESTAAETLGKVGQVDPQAVISPLSQALKASCYRLKNAAIRILGQLSQAASDTVIPLLLEVLKDEDEGHRKTAVIALGKVGKGTHEAVISALHEALKDQHCNVRSVAVAALYQISQASPQTVIPNLLEALKDKDHEVRQAAVEGLELVGQADPQTVIPALYEALKDQEGWVSMTARNALQKLCQADSNAVIATLIEALGDQNGHVRMAAVKTLGQVGHINPEAVIPCLLQALEDKAYGVKAAAALALGKVSLIGHLTVVPALLQALKDEAKDVREASAIALGKVGQIDPQAIIPALLQALKDKKPNVRKAAAKTLGQIGQAEPRIVIPALIEALKDGYGISGNTAEALGQIGHFDLQIVIPALLEAFKNRACPRGQIVKALGKMGHIDSQVIQTLIETLKDTFDWREAAQVLQKFDLSFYLKSHPQLLDSSGTYKICLTSTSLTSLINCYKKDPSQSLIYSKAVAKKCLEENLPFFQTETTLCFYEQGKLCSIDVPNARQFATQIEKWIPEYPEFADGMCCLQ